MNPYGPYSTSQTSGVNVHETYEPGSPTGMQYMPEPPFSIGQVVEGTDESEWVFCLAGGTLVAGDVVQLSPVWVATQLSTANGLLGQIVAVVPVDVASGNYFWAQIDGLAANVNIVTGTAANVALATSATAGRLGPAGTGNRPLAIAGTALAAANLAPGILNEPTVTAAAL